MNITPPTPNTATGAVTAVRNVQGAPKAYGIEAAKPTAGTQMPDRAELTHSGELHRLIELAKGGDVRADKVAAIKTQINAGTYDVAGKADLVADRLLDDLGV